MIETKIFEIRDIATTCVAICTLAPSGNYDKRKMFEHQGYGGFPLVIMHVLNKDKATHDPFKWGDRTFKTAHQYIHDKWNSLESGGLVDVQFILGETEKPKTSDIFR